MKRNVIKIILTLRNVDHIIPHLSYELVISKIERLYNTKPNILIVKELHKTSGYHYHILIISEEGISKNTYINLYREQFNLFEGRLLNIQGVKSLKITVNYFLKDLNVGDLIKIVNKDKETIIYTNTRIKFFFRKDKELSKILTVIEIVNFKTFDEFITNTISHSIIQIINPKQLTTCWNLSRKFISSTECIPYIYELQECSFNDYIAIINKYNIRITHLRIIRRIVYFILIKEGWYPQEVKSKNLVVVGAPNTGKTSLLYKIIEVFDNSHLFYFVGSRPNDFSKYNSNLNPIIVFDDVLTYPHLNWDPGLLLKVLGHEPIVVDVKYGTPIEVVPSNVIIFSNKLNLFRERKDRNLKERIVLFNLNDIVDWYSISNKEIQILLFVIIEDLIISLDQYPLLKSFIKYGIVCEFKKGDRQSSSEIITACYSRTPTGYKDKRGNYIKWVPFTKEILPTDQQWEPSREP